MIEAYAIGVNLSLRGNIAGEVAKVATQFENLNRIIARSQLAVNELAAGMRGLSGIARTAADAWKEAAAAMERAARATKQAAAGSSGSASSAAPAPLAPLAIPAPSNMLRLPRPTGPSVPIPGTDFTMWNDPALPTGGASRPLMGPPVAPPGNSGGPGAGALATIPTTGTFAGGPGSPYTPGLPMVPPGGPGGRGPISLNYTAPWTRPAAPGSHDLMLAATGFGLVGAALTEGVSAAFHAAAEIKQRLTVMGNQGFTADELKQSAQRARDLQRNVPGIRQEQGLHIIQDLFTVLQNANETLAPGLVESYAKAGIVLQSVGKGDAIFELFKSMQGGELRGAFSGNNGDVDTAKAAQFLSNVLATTNQTGGRIGPSEILQVVKSSGLAAGMMSDKTLFAQMIAPALSLGPAAAGRGMQAFASQFVAGKMSDAAVKLMLRMKLIENLPPEAGTTAGQQFEYLKPQYKTGIGQWALPLNMMPYRNNPELNPAEHPIDFMRSVLEPAMKAYNLRVNGPPRDAKDEMVQLQALSLALASRIPAGNLEGDVLRNMPLIVRDEKAVQGALQRGANDGFFNRLQEDSPNVKMEAFSAAMNGLLIALGGPIMDSAIESIKHITDALNWISDKAEAHPQLAGWLMTVGAGLGALSLGTAALSSVFLLAPAMWAVTKWFGLAVGLGRLGTAIELLGAGSAAGAAMKSAPAALGGLASAIVGFAGRLAALGYLAHMGVSAVDPKDTMGSWIDRNIPGAAAVDDWFARHLGVGRTHQEQHEADPEHTSPASPGRPHSDAVPPSQNPFLNPASYRPPPVNLDQKVEIHVHGQIDGRTLLSFVSERLLRSGSGPSGGSTGFDARTVYSGGMAAA